jgi:cytochrome d ubiquinol oxidase subunit I
VTSHSSPGPTRRTRSNRFAISIPRGASLILTHDPNGLFPGLKSVPPDQRPPIAPVFFAFRIMVGIGLLMIATGAYRRMAVVARHAHHHALVPADHAIRLVARFRRGAVRWITTEVGRQPWIVHGIMRTSEAISPVSAASVLATLVLFVIVYGIVFAMGIYYINRLIVRGPQGPGDRTPARHRAEVRSPPPGVRHAKRCGRGRKPWNGTSR